MTCICVGTAISNSVQFDTKATQSFVPVKNEDPIYPARRMTITLRRAKEGDTPALSHICLLTGNAGKSAEANHDYGELPGLVYAVPYVNLPTTWGFVMVDEDRSGLVVGYILGSTDTRQYEKHAAERWWPSLAGKYDPATLVGKPEDLRYAKLLRDMHTAPETNVAFSPAHLHVDILEEYQRKGWGRKLIAEAVNYLKGQGLDRVWLGMDPRNQAARLFYESLGFERIEGSDDNQLGLVLDNFKQSPYRS